MTTGRINQVTIPGLRHQTGSLESAVPVHLGVRPIGPSCKASDTVHQPSGRRWLRQPLAGHSGRVDRLGRQDCSQSRIAHQQNGATHSHAWQHGAVEPAEIHSLPPLRLPQRFSCSACRAMPPPEYDSARGTPRKSSAGSRLSRPFHSPRVIIASHPSPETAPHLIFLPSLEC